MLDSKRFPALRIGSLLACVGDVSVLAFDEPDRVSRAKHMLSLFMVPRLSLWTFFCCTAYGPTWQPVAVSLFVTSPTRFISGGCAGLFFFLAGSFVAGCLPRLLGRTCQRPCVTPGTMMRGGPTGSLQNVTSRSAAAVDGAQQVDRPTSVILGHSGNVNVLLLPSLENGPVRDQSCRWTRVHDHAQRVSLEAATADHEELRLPRSRGT